MTLPASTPRPGPALTDPFQRAITYLRVSVTDRCDLRCRYCMAERMTFLPKREVLSFEELDRIVSGFVALGVRKVRLTGGEPLVRRDAMQLVARLSRHLDTGALEELTLTTNATQLEAHAAALHAHGVRRINVSLDTLDPERFRAITRRDAFGAVMRGIDAAEAAGVRIKINTVALRHDNADELARIVEWAHGRGFDACLIETMPMGEVGEDRTDQYLPLSEVRRGFEAHWTLRDVADRTGGPARYVRVAETGGRLGFITPLTHNFCESCNRVRLTCTGRLYMCLGQEDAADLRSVVRANPDDGAALAGAIREAIARKPKGHDFDISRRGAAPAVPRTMSHTGG